MLFKNSLRDTLALIWSIWPQSIEEGSILRLSRSGVLCSLYGNSYTKVKIFKRLRRQLRQVPNTLPNKLSKNEPGPLLCGYMHLNLHLIIGADKAILLSHCIVFCYFPQFLGMS